jgi:anthranilate phosphoribosyltransferase
MAHALHGLGVRRALVVHSADGTDEISLSSPTSVREVTPDGVRAYQVSPADFGVPGAGPEAVHGGDAETNAAILQEILRGERGPHRDAAVVNAAAALYAAGSASSLADGTRIAAEAIDSRAAARMLNRLRDVSQGVRQQLGSAA